MISKPFKNKYFKLIILLASLHIFSFPTQARTLVLVHGFMGDHMAWRTSKFIQPLIRSGWKDGGSYNFNQWRMLTPNNVNHSGDAFFTVNVPSQANIQTQESILAQYLQHLYSRRIEPITLVGHSAGGVVARLYALNPNRQPINGLITIASPHLGTPTANLAYLAGNSPIGMMASMVGGDTLQDSRGLFSDLKEEEPYNFLYWMNHQPHPDIHYASIIRESASISKPKSFDYVVPSNSQNMNNIWALQNRSGTALSKENHSLNAKDGELVLSVLKHIN